MKLQRLEIDFAPSARRADSGVVPVSVLAAAVLGLIAWLLRE